MLRLVRVELVSYARFYSSRESDLSSPGAYYSRQYPLLNSVRYIDGISMTK